MNVFKDFADLLFKNEIKNKINDIMKDFCDLSQLNIGISLETLDITKIKIEDIIFERNKSKFLAQLSLYLWNNFEYIEDFMIKALYDDGTFKERMDKLGFVYENHYWRSVRRPEIFEVHTNIFLYGMCISLYNKMEFTEAHIQNMKNEQYQRNLKNIVMCVEESSNSEIIGLQPQARTSLVIAEQEQWKCTLCSTVNQSEKCNGCNEERKRILLRECEEEVSCRSVSPNNEGSEHVDQGRKKDERVVGNTGGWTCTFCTFINESTYMNCEVCNRMVNKGNVIIKEESKSTEVKKTEIKNFIFITALPMKTVEDINQNKTIEKNEEEHIVAEIMSKWTCTFCTFINNSINYNCEVCNQERETSIKDEGMTYTKPRRPSYTPDKNKVDNDIKKDTWECPSCTFKNTLQNLCCETCYTIKEVDVPLKENENDDQSIEEVDECVKGTWQCVHCKKENLYDRYTCGSCRKYAPFFKKWICERCSFFNNEIKERCQMCKEKNVHLKTCIKCKKMTKMNDVDLCEDCQSKDTIKGETGWKRKKYIKRAIKNEVNIKEEIPTEIIKDKYYCNNRWCGTINCNKLKHCSKCKLKKNANITFFNTVNVFNRFTYSKMWQCTFCGEFNTKVACGNCKNLRHNQSCMKCSKCNWVNESVDKLCNKCSAIL